MSSKVLSVLDYHDVPLDVPSFSPDEAALEHALERLANAHAAWREGEVVSSGDMVVCDLASSVERFQRDGVRFVAGSGMFDLRIESALLGCRVGEKIEVPLPEGSVFVTLRSVTNRVVPTPSDEMVRDLGIDGVDNLEGYRRHLLDAQRAEHLGSVRFEIVQALERAVVAGSEFSLDEEDWRRAVRLELDHCAALARQEGMDIKTMTPEQFAGRIPVRSYEELVAMTEESSWDSLRRFVLGRYYAGQDGFTVREGDYLDHLAEYARAWHLTEAQARDAQPWELYCFTAYCNHAYDLWGSWVERRYYELNA